MELVNAANDYRRDVPPAARDAALRRARRRETLVLLMAPYAPHMAEELWREVLGEDGSVHRQSWPAFDAAAAAADELEIAGAGQRQGARPAHRPGRHRPRTSCASARSASAKVAAHLEGKTVRKVVVVPGQAREHRRGLRAALRGAGR